MSGRSKITIKQVADKADVSIATVSRIMNNKDTVKEETRRKVLDAMAALEYTPASAPSPLTDATSNTILLCVPDFSNPFNSRVIDGVQKSASANHYHVLLLQSKDVYLNFGDYEAVLKNHSIAGVILLTSVTSPKLVDDLRMRCPVVMCSEYCSGNDITFVSIDDVLAARQATEYLISCGRRRIALLNSSLQHKYARHRESGYRRALQEAGLAAYDAWIAHVPTVSYGLAMSHANYILSQPECPDAFFAVSDVYAVAILRAAKKLGLRVPEDVAIVGFDNIELSSMTDPPITTVSQPSFQIGYQSCELLIEKLHHPLAASKQIILETELVVRESTPRLFG